MDLETANAKGLGIPDTFLQRVDVIMGAAHGPTQIP
jgi:hypothetical protein